MFPYTSIDIVTFAQDEEISIINLDNVGATIYQFIFENIDNR